MLLGLDFRTLRQRSLWYWLFALLAILVGMTTSSYLDEKHIWIELRYGAYQALDWVSPNPREPKHTVLVLVGDAEYWTGPLARRTPIHRDYLASVVKALDACEPSVIALDFDLRSPMPDGSVRDNPEYAKETEALVATVLDVSKRRPVVLPAMIRHNTPEDPFSIESSVYGDLPFSKGKLQRGYINLPFDVRRVPTPQPLVTGGLLDSFSVSIVRARHENVLKVVQSSEVLPFSTFIKKSLPTLSTTDVLKGNCGAIPSNVAIVGAAWSRSAVDTGGPIDIHPTPLGQMSGATIHANYVEALLDTSTRKPLPHRAERGVEFLVSAAFAILLAIKTKRSYQKLLVVLLSCLVLLFFSYVAWQNLGYYFDFFFPVVFLLLHAFLHYFSEIQTEARAFKRMPH